jgi:hypothetical protein
MLSVVVPKREQRVYDILSVVLSIAILPNVVALK